MLRRLVSSDQVMTDAENVINQGILRKNRLMTLQVLSSFRSTKRLIKREFMEMKSLIRMLRKLRIHKRRWQSKTFGNLRLKFPHQILMIERFLRINILLLIEAVNYRASSELGVFIAFDILPHA